MSNHTVSRQGVVITRPDETDAREARAYVSVSSLMPATLRELERTMTCPLLRGPAICAFSARRTYTVYEDTLRSIDMVQSRALSTFEQVELEPRAADDKLSPTRARRMPTKASTRLLKCLVDLLRALQCEKNGRQGQGGRP